MMDERLRSAMLESTKRHSESADVSFAAYRQTRYHFLRQFVASRRLAYLDMNFWINLANSQRSPEWECLLSHLREDVSSGRLLCPVSYTQFTELLKQNQADGRQLRVARLMDELSVGVGLRNPFDIAQMEFLQFFAESIPRLSGYIDHPWAPIGHLIHEVYPYHDELPGEVMEFERKVMLDVQWSMSMEILADRHWPAFTRNTAGEINEARKVHTRNGRSFDDLLQDELVGVLEGIREHVVEIAVQMERARFDQSEIQAFTDLGVQALAELCVKARDTNRKIVPSQRIHAALHAQMRMEDGRRFKENDLDDFRHACSAVAYCDFFFSDGPLVHLLRKTNVTRLVPDTCHICCNAKTATTMLSLFEL